MMPSSIVCRTQRSRSVICGNGTSFVFDGCRSAVFVFHVRLLDSLSGDEDLLDLGFLDLGINVHPVFGHPEMFA